MRFGVGSKRRLFNWKMILLAGIIFFALPFIFPQNEVSAAATGSYLSNSQFETWMTSQGFPESYKPYLRALHKKHPGYVFKATKTRLDWNYVSSRENVPGKSVVSSSSYASYKSFENGCYNFSSNTYKVFDGHWNQASPALVNYYLDPRNFLNENDLFMFFYHGQCNKSYDNTKTIRGITDLKSYSFMHSKIYKYNKKKPNYALIIHNAGVKAGVNGPVLASMIVTEQGWSGTSGLISGTYKNYKGYYNYFNIGAYTTRTMSATQRGLWYAKGEGKNKTTYGRPWNSRSKAIYGGAVFYNRGYMKNRQYTYYTKKFNVLNGAANVGKHEYMTNVQGAQTEGRLLKNAYGSSGNTVMTFYIPVYYNMPAKACAKPGTSGNNDNVLNSLYVKSGPKLKTKYSSSPGFTRYGTTYTVKLPKKYKKFCIYAKAHSSSAAVSITGIRTTSKNPASYARTISQNSSSHSYQICVKSSSGQYRYYTLRIIRK